MKIINKPSAPLITSIICENNADNELLLRIIFLRDNPQYDEDLVPFDRAIGRAWHMINRVLAGRTTTLHYSSVALPFVKLNRFGNLVITVYHTHWLQYFWHRFNAVPYAPFGSYFMLPQQIVEKNRDESFTKILQDKIMLLKDREDISTNVIKFIKEFKAKLEPVILGEII